MSVLIQVDSQEQADSIARLIAVAVVFQAVDRTPKANIALAASKVIDAARALIPPRTPVALRRMPSLEVTLEKSLKRVRKR